MKIKLSKSDVEKILSKISLDQLEEKLEANWSYWEVRCEAMHEVILVKKEEVREL